MEENINEAKMLRGEEHHDRSMAKERVGAPDTKTPWRKTSMREEAPGPVAPPCPEEEDATLDPRAIGMTGIEAKVRAEG